ncbi:N-acetyltransferase family protein [Bittarella sp. HCP28S3_D9]|uniref:GNAT family N-acetyltransferase n=1 Tax=Bittarella sp. HCP28S3_D9 TaxID=3440253 RepID=UPI003F88C3C1
MDSLLHLSLHLHETSLPPEGEGLRAAWRQLLDDPGCHLIVAEEEGRILASCTCYLLPNLTRGARPFALVENAVTHPDHRRRGCATACLRQAEEVARRAGCYKIVLMSGAKDEGTLSFYREAGFDSGEKTAFIRRF